MPKRTETEDRVVVINEEQVDLIRDGDLAFVKTTKRDYRLTEAPIDGNHYVIKNGEWVVINL